MKQPYGRMSTKRVPPMSVGARNTPVTDVTHQLDPNVWVVIEFVLPQ